MAAINYSYSFYYLVRNVIVKYKKAVGWILKIIEIYDTIPSKNKPNPISASVTVRIAFKILGT